MKFREVFMVIALLSIFAGGLGMLEAQTVKKLTLDDIFKSGKFNGKTVSDIQWLPDGSAFTFTRSNSQKTALDVYRHNVKTGKETLILEGASLTYDRSPQLATLQVSLDELNQSYNHVKVERMSLAKQAESPQKEKMLKETYAQITDILARRDATEKQLIANRENPISEVKMSAYQTTGNQNNLLMYHYHLL